MGLHVSLGTTSSEKRQLDKQVTYSHSYEGVLHNESNVVNPSILIKVPASAIAGCNYMSVTEFGRLYFITDITAVSADLSLVSGHCDVLSTYKTGIRTNSAIIARSSQQGNWNLYLTDPMLNVNSKSEIITKGGWIGFPKDQFSLMLITMG
ncbi:MAG: hypothetical protein IIY21_18730 [Clostridiales bacterium]|nr:hypothetical protein [Clostridiales bacterium]MBQ1570567.1 hypothetical protein [Clostridiales bacterium]